MNLGIVKFGTLSKKRNLFWEFNINWDRYEDDHSPAFQLELTILNCYNHLWVYKNNPVENES